MSVALVKGRPLSPPSSANGEIYQHGLHHLIQHNASNSFSSDQYDYDERFGTESRATSSYGSSPYQPQEERHRFSNSQPNYTYHASQNPGHSMQRNAYRDSYQHDDHTYGASPDEHQMYQNSYDTPAESPSTPAMPETILTRSGFSITRPSPSLKTLPEDKPRQTKVQKLRKGVRREKDKSVKKKVVEKLDKPLSELCKDWTHITVTDIEAYVNRSAEERRKEVEDAKDPGKVKRPMNSFMLYRKAYQHVTKEFYLHNNHQFVSQVCGDSWKLETDEIIKQFKQWATLERINHANAHPGYKFRPSKAGAVKAASKRKNTDELESELDTSDLEDYDWEGSNGVRRSAKKARQMHSQERQPPPYQPSSSPYGYSRDVSTEPMHQGHNRSSYQATNPGKPLPPQYNQEQLHTGQYYQQTVHHNTGAPGIEDVVIRKTAAPSMHYLGLPRGQGLDIMQPQYGGGYNSTPAPESRIDPSLLDEHFMSDESYASQMGAYIGQEEYHDDSIFPASYGVLDQQYYDNAVDYLEAAQPLDINTLQLQDQHAHLLKGSQDAWQIDQSLDAGQEFDNWYEAAH